MNDQERVAALLRQGVQLSVENGRLRLSLKDAEDADSLCAIAEEREREITALLEDGCKYADVSFAQQRMWFLDRLATHAQVANNPYSAFRVRGPLRIDVLERSIQEFARRHEPMRTTFADFNGQPCQVVRPPCSTKVREVDLTEWPASERERRLKTLAAQEIRSPFNIAQFPLFRITAFRLGAEEVVLAFVCHHIITDGWSMMVFAKELAAHYEAGLADSHANLDPLPLSYSDAVGQQRRRLTGERLERLLEYWKTALGSGSPVLNLPCDRPRPVNPTHKGGRCEFTLSSNATEALKALARAENVTLFVALLTVLKVLLSRYTNQDDIVVGSPNAGRTSSKVRGLFGLFLNTMVLRTDLSGDPAFVDALRRVQDVVRGAMRNAELPLEQLVSELRPDRHVNRSPLFQVLFVYLNIAMHELKLPGLQTAPYRIDSGASDFDLTLMMWETEGQLAGYFQYSTDLFDQKTVERIARHFQVLLEGAVADSNEAVSKLPLLSSDEEEQLVHGWNASRFPLPENITLQTLFEDQVGKTPHALALVYENRRITYAQLNRRANLLARRLIDRGVGPGAYVGVFADRSIEFVVALLGVVKAGGAFVPLDPDYPDERIETMLEDAHPEVVLTQTQIAGRLSHVKSEVIRIEPDCPPVASEPLENPDVRAGSGDPAYVVYTSGSTGAPKGAINRHEGVCNRMVWIQKNFPLTAEDRVLHKTPVGFDVTVSDVFWPLFAGATLVIARPGGHRDTAYLAKTIQEHGITTIHFVPSMLRAFLDDERASSCTSLKRVFSGGETLTRELVQRFFARLNAELHNQYGPAEAAIDVVYWQCKPDDRQLVVPIGRPIANTQIYILDAHMQPVPVGVPGEIHIGGAQVGAGYLNRKALTDERFVPDPFSERAGARLYKTGDRARFRPDGVVEFLGRMDYQVKIRGCRVELGEIEAAIVLHDAVRDAVVCEWGKPDETTRLIAYVVTRPEAAIQVRELRDVLRNKLPEYMIPSIFLQLDALPLSANGKLDRSMLPAPTADPCPSTRPTTSPESDIEKRLAAIWCKLLHLESAGMEDDFFESGGHSLLTVELVQAIKKEFGVDLPLQRVFEAPTLSEIAQHISELSNNGADDARYHAYHPSSLVPIQPSGSKTPLFLAAPAGGVVFVYYNLLPLLDPDQPLYGLQDPVLCEPGYSCKNISDLAARYISEMRSVQPMGPYMVGGWSFGGVVAYEIACQLRDSGEEVSLVALIDVIADGRHWKHGQRMFDRIKDLFWTPVWIAGQSVPYVCDGLYLYLSGFLRRRDRNQANQLTFRDRVHKVWGNVAREWLVKKATVSQVAPDDSRLAMLQQPDARKAFRNVWANMRMYEAFRPRPYSGTVTLFQAGDYGVDGRPVDDPVLGWDRFAEKVELHRLDGNHVNLMTNPYIRNFATALERAIAQAQNNETSKYESGRERFDQEVTAEGSRR